MARRNAGSWDAAKKGSGAVEAVWKTALLFETQKFKSIHVAALFLDLKKFSDYIGWDVLLDEACLVAYPVQQLILTLEQYMCPRAVSKYTCLSEWCSISNSITAGCGRAIDMIRCYLYRACSKITHEFPVVAFREFVDDLVIAACGQHEICGSQMCKVDQAPHERAPSQAMRYSSKNTGHGHLHVWCPMVPVSMKQFVQRLVVILFSLKRRASSQ